jgi:hypothetical protein
MDLSNEQFDEIIYIDDPSLLNETDPLVLAEKETGDRVTIIDYSGTGTVEGAEISDEELCRLSFSDEFIVIETGQNTKLKETFIIYTQDLVVYHPKSGRKYRTSSCRTRLAY